MLAARCATAALGRPLCRIASSAPLLSSCNVAAAAATPVAAAPRCAPYALAFSRRIANVAGEEGEVADEAAVAAAKKAARLAKKEKAKAIVQVTKKSESEARRAKKEAQKDASLRADQKFKLTVIEKEVPLMDLTGIKPGQNKFSNVLEVLREESFPTEVVADLQQIGDFATGSTREILSGRIANLCEKFGRKPYDTGSPEVQVAVLTERLKGFDRHMVEHKSDINSRRGFLAIWHQRRKMLKYLRRTKYETYAFVMKELQLREADIDSVGLDRTSGTQAARIKRD